MFIFDPSTSSLVFQKKASAASPNARLNAQTLSQDWELFTGTLEVLSYVDLATFTFEIDTGATLEII